MNRVVNKFSNNSFAEWGDDNMVPDTPVDIYAFGMCALETAALEINARFAFFHDLHILKINVSAVWLTFPKSLFSKILLKTVHKLFSSPVLVG
jgi:hypothetical protein